MLVKMAKHVQKQLKVESDARPQDMATALNKTRRQQGCSLVIDFYFVKGAENIPHSEKLFSH